jgi:parvulin-like peptidyl-prolyl isomerase
MKKPRTRLSAARLRNNVRTIIPPVPKRFKKVKGEERIQEAFENIPRITNETVAEHREDVLRGARKYKYPLQHSKHAIVITSTTLLIMAVVGFFIYATLSLYKFQSSSAFMYRVTQVLPFPVARAGSHFVSYENYLFELRRYEHYYQTQQRVNFAGKDGKRQLAQKVAATLDTAAQAKAKAALVQVQGGADFAAMVNQYSDAVDKANGGQYGDASISEASTDVPPAVVRALEKLQVGQTSGVIQAGNTLEIVKLTGAAAGKMQAAHISINVTPIQTYVDQYAKVHPTHHYIKVQ